MKTKILANFQICISVTLNNTISELQSETSITRSANKLISSKLVALECHCCSNAQYSRRTRRYIVGILSEVKNETLQGVTWGFLII